MTAFETQTPNGSTETALPEIHEAADRSESLLSSPFASSDLFVADPAEPRTLTASMTSPFTDGFVTEAGIDADAELADFLMTELEDNEFAEALEALATEAAARYVQSPTVWNQESGTGAFDPTDAEQWMETIATRVDEMLGELESRFADRSVESVGEDEIDQLLETGFPTLEAFSDPIDAQELFFGRLKKKLKKIARAAKRVIKKGVKIASRFLPLGIIFRRLRPIIRPLLRRVLARAIGKLPRSLRGPARKLARKFGLRSEAEFENDFEHFAAEFDAETAEAMLGADDDFAALEHELQSESQADELEPNLAEQLDLARLRLGQELVSADPGEPPVAAMEQFIPMALLPIAKMGIKIAGRRRVISFVAGPLAKLIAPIVGRQLARPLSTQIADKGLGLLGLEAEADHDRLGPEALVAAAEDTIREVFELPEEWLENELVLEMAVQDAFQAAAARHFPSSALRAELSDPEGEEERGVWLMMPRSTAPAYRYKQYSKVLPVRITPRLARSVVFSDGETLAERLADEAIGPLPMDGEVEVYELLPGADVGHIAALQSGPEPGSVLEAVREFDTLAEAGELRLPDEGERRRSGRSRRIIRVKVGGRGLRRRSPIAMRLDLSRSQPIIRLHLTIGERRALAIVDRLGKQQHREVVAIVTRAGAAPMRRVVAKRLLVMLRRRQLRIDDAMARTLTDALFDGLIAALGSQIQALSPSLVTAAKDPAAGLTLTAAFPFPSRDALVAGSPSSPSLTVRPGRHRD